MLSLINTKIRCNKLWALFFLFTCMHIEPAQSFLSKNAHLSMLYATSGFHHIVYIGAQFIYIYGLLFIDSIMKIKSVKNNVILYCCYKTKQQGVFQRYCQDWSISIDENIKKIRQNLKTDEKAARDNLYKVFNLSEEQIKQLNNSLDYSYTDMQNYLSSNDQCNKADNQDILFAPETIRYLQAQKINHLNINIKCYDETIYATNGEPAIATARSFKDTSEQGAILYPEISLYPLHKVCSLINQQGNIEHELAHIVLHHGITQRIISNKLIDYEKITAYDDLNKNEYWKNLIIEHERQAEILNKNAHSASIMRQYRGFYGIGHYRKTLYLNHYKQLAEIDELLKLQGEINDCEI